MNSDCYFSMGKSHMVCEDYAYAGINSNGNQVAVVSDGCSASPDTDFGSRFLVRSAVVCGENTGYCSRETYAESLIRSIIWCAYQTGSGLHLSRQSLDATILYLEVVEEEIRIVTAGDGVIFAVDHENKLEYWDIDYASGAPFYPSYLLDEKRYLGYIENCGTESTISHFTSESSIALDVEHSGVMGNYMCLPKKSYKFVGVASDGILTFDMSTEEAIIQLAAYKNTKGEFVKRRMRKFLKQCVKNNTSPSDDVSMAVVHLGDENE
jgi:hypothetical protein